MARSRSVAPDLIGLAEVAGVARPKGRCFQSSWKKCNQVGRKPGRYAEPVSLRRNVRFDVFLDNLHVNGARNDFAHVSRQLLSCTSDASVNQNPLDMSPSDGVL